MVLQYIGGRGVMTNVHVHVYGGMHMGVIWYYIVHACEVSRSSCNGI